MCYNFNDGGWNLVVVIGSHKFCPTLLVAIIESILRLAEKVILTYDSYLIEIKMAVVIGHLHIMM